MGVSSLPIDGDRIDQLVVGSQFEGGVRRQLLGVKGSSQTFEDQPALTPHNPKVSHSPCNSLENAVFELEGRFGFCEHLHDCLRSDIGTQGDDESSGSRAFDFSYFSHAHRVPFRHAGSRLRSADVKTHWQTTCC